jgi:hypothetical protein
MPAMVGCCSGCVLALLLVVCPAGWLAGWLAEPTERAEPISSAARQRRDRDG